MGMYTELHYNVELKRNVPEEVLAILRYMLDERPTIPLAGEEARQERPPVPKHDLFKTEHWPEMLLMDSYYFSADTHSTLRFDDISQSYFLCVRSNLKNYDGEIKKFIDWMDPYLDEHPGCFLGFYRYEETETPTLIYKR